MIKKFERIISTTQSKYKAILEKKSITQQCSYNLPNEMESFLKSINAINRITPNGADTNVIYELNSDYRMTLGDNILAIIGNEYSSKENKVVFTHTEGVNGGSQKLQLKKTDFSSRGNDYKWFVDLYEKNIELVNFVAFVDDAKKEIKFDIELSKELFNGETISDDSPDEANSDEFSYNFTEDELGQTLKDMVQEGPKIVKIHLFGIKYGIYIKNKNYSVKNIANKAGLSDIYVAEINKGIALASYVKELKPLTDVKENNMASVEEYLKFKNLLNWFVTQLNINNGIQEGEKHSGHGYNGEKIREYYKDWRDYENFSLDCTISSGYNSSISKANYINKTGTGINIRPTFSSSERKEVVDLYIDIFSTKNCQDNETVNNICDKHYEISKLGLNDEIPNDLLKSLFDDYETIINLLSNIKLKYCLENFDSSFERNRIIFGAPGTGKSYKLNEDVNNFAKNTFERVTFHPDYTYANFVGTYKPVPDKNNPKDITYKYVPGPFMRTLVKALKSINDSDIAEEYKNKPYVLVIEEINRANVAAVFGEVFQLLDRTSNGESKYEINASEDIKNYLVEELGGQPEDFDTIKIPNNMFIWATMNSADQGVFPVDTAFKRRWSFEYIGINENDNKISSYEITIANKTFKWNDLRKSINNFLAKNRVNEDKLLGPFFIEEKILNDNKKFLKTFKDKVIMYLFEDAGRQLRNSIFVSENKSPLLYSKICENFDKDGISIFNNEIQGGIENVESNN